MRAALRIAVILLVSAANHCALAVPTIELELATERGVQITAPHEWLQLLTSLGFDNVRIRALRAGDEPKVVNRGSDQRPRYHVVGILTARHELRLPGEAFSRSDRRGLKDYFDRLTAEGPESLTATRGWFGLTEKELSAILAGLSQPIEFETKQQPIAEVLERLGSRLAVPIVVDPAASRMLGTATVATDELKGITIGTGLAIMLRSSGLVVRPDKLRGQPISLKIEPADKGAVGESTLGVRNDVDGELRSWPIGWELEQPPGRLAPSLFEYRNAEIEGYTLKETLSAIGTRVTIPMYIDHAALAAAQIDPDKVQVRLARTRSIYKRIIDRVLAQSRLGSELRVDEAGSPFLWITR